MWVLVFWSAEERQAQEAAHIYSKSMSVVFDAGGVGGQSFGDRCWHSGNNAVVFSRGVFALAVGVPGEMAEKKLSTLMLFADALDRKAQEAMASGSRPQPLSDDVVRRARGKAATSDREFSDALAAKSVDVLARYTASPRADESERAITALAKTVEGREALFKQLSDAETDKLHARLILAALGNAGTPDAIDYVQRYARSTDNPKIYGSAFEAAAKAMPREQSREFCLAEARRLATDIDASAEKLTLVVKGLSPRLMDQGDPEETVILREIVTRTRDEELRRASLRVLAAWVTDGSDLRGEILKLMNARLADADPRVRSCAARAIGAGRDLRDLPLLMPLLDDPDATVCDSAIEAISILLKTAMPARTEAPGAQPSSDDMKARLQPVLQALKTLDEASRGVLSP